MSHSIDQTLLVKRLLIQQVAEVSPHSVLILPVRELLLHILKHLVTLMLAPPCLGPFREAMAAAMVEYVSVPEEVTTWVVNVELLPPPWSMCSTSAISRILASSLVYFRSSRSIIRIFSAVGQLR